MIDLDQLIEHANELDPLPASTVRLAQLVNEPNCHLTDLTEIISFDQALTVKLLRAANSAASASATPVGTVEDSVLRLGVAQVLALAVAAGAKPLLQKRASAYGMEEGALWRHSVAAAIAAETASNLCQVKPPPEAFTAALLHDVGKLIMSRFLDPTILAYIRQAQEVDHLGQLEAESLLLNVHHGEIGGLIAQHWQLPPRVVQGIIYHHNPEHGLDPICDFTYLANHVAKSVEGGLGGDGVRRAVGHDVQDRVGLSVQALDQLCMAAATRYSEVSRRYDAV